MYSILSTFPVCKRCFNNGISDCNCDPRGTVEEVCQKETGQCICKPGYGGARCDQCQPGYFGHPECVSCNCSSSGSASAICDFLGKCPCYPSFSGRRCDQCSPGHFKYPECISNLLPPFQSYQIQMSCLNPHFYQLMFIKLLLLLS